MVEFITYLIILCNRLTGRGQDSDVNNCEKSKNTIHWF